MTTSQDFEVEEVFTDDGELLVLSLGFASPQDPLDILHLVCGKALSGRIPRPLEDELYVERTDQSLACTGQVVRLAVEDGGIVLTLTEAGMAQLQLPATTRFRFSRHPDLFAVAAEQLARMARAGHPNISLEPDEA